MNATKRNKRRYLKPKAKVDWENEEMATNMSLDQGSPEYREWVMDNLGIDEKKQEDLIKQQDLDKNVSIKKEESKFHVEVEQRNSELPKELDAKSNQQNKSNEYIKQKRIRKELERDELVKKMKKSKDMEFDGLEF